jgi:nucleoid-associated protein YgaU
MKIITTFLGVMILIFFSSSFLFAQSYNYEEMEMEEYNALLQEWQGRLDAGQQAITEEDGKIESATTCIDEQQTQIDATWDEIYTALGSSKAEDEAFRKDAQQLRSDVSSFLSMSPDEIYRRKDELQGFKDRLAEMKANNLALLSENEATLNSIESLIMQAEEKGKPAEPDTYTVMRGDYLWRIANKPDIYGDPYAWMRIYTSNTDLIKDPDLIYPQQSFRIPRDVGPNEHLVMRGEFLSKIAGYANVYGSSFQWSKLYEANKITIEDPNLIYPHQVLSVPRN